MGKIEQYSVLLVIGMYFMIFYCYQFFICKSKRYFFEKYHGFVTHDDRREKFYTYQGILEAVYFLSGVILSRDYFLLVVLYVMLCVWSILWATVSFQTLGSNTKIYKSYMGITFIIYLIINIVLAQWVGRNIMI